MSEPVGNSPRGAIPGNSHKIREEQTTVAAEVAPRERVEKIIEGSVVRRKPKWYTRIVKNMIADDAANMGEYIFDDVIGPALRNLVFDIITQGAQRALFGTARRGVGGIRGGGLGLGGSIISQRVSYDRMSNDRPSMSREARARHDFDEIVLTTRNEAVDVVSALIGRVERYGSATVSDLYDLLGVTGSYADQKWGWVDLRNADVRQVRGGFLLDLPRPEPVR